MLAHLASHEIYEGFILYTITIDLEAIDFLLSATGKRHLSVIKSFPPG